MVNGSRKNKVNNPSHPSRTYGKRLRDAVLFYLSLSSTFALKKTWLLPIFLIL